MRQFILFLCGLLPIIVTAQTISSPDGSYVLTMGNSMTYSISFKGKKIVEKSQMGVEIDNRLFESALGVPRGVHENWCSDLELKGEARTTVDTTWTPLYGENARIRDHYNQLVLHYEKGSQEGAVEGAYDKREYYAMDIIVRAYNEGVAFRYHFPETANSLFLHIKGEQTSFRMPEGTMAWYEEWAQGPYQRKSLVIKNEKIKIKKEKEGEGSGWFESERPLLMIIPPRGDKEGITYVALLEAAMKDYTRGKFKLKNDNELQVAMYDCADIISPYNTPWRVIMAGEKAVDLINHKDLVLNLNEERAQKDWSWVKPGKAFRSGKLEKSAIFKSIDFCAEFGIDYVELDAGWYGPEGKVSSDARKVIKTRDFTMPEVFEYAKSKGIGVWVYVNQRALYNQLDELLPLYQQWGIKGIKFGFVQIGNQQWSTWLHNAVEKCAKYQLMVDIHDEYRPTGLSRTYPNLLTQEGIMGNECMPDATHDVTLPFTRFLCGPADYTLCYFNNRVQSTKGHQLAMAAVYYSPLQFLFWYDNPYPDGWDSEELKFWKDCPTVFDESIALDGFPGEYIIQARRSGEEWFVGALTNTEARTVSIPTDFLPIGKYDVTIYNDDPTLGTQTKVGVSSQIVNRKSSNRKSSGLITLHLQPSGGAALHFKPIK
ncbi:MAG: glycoside hydrolase family 97 catalytic domain-containing protein [Bacteroidaceae bacterium]|nr:glycoside hydrolase family 97 catalytic domain-containing protein [Bacteroidaceae bacterium]